MDVLIVGNCQVGPLAVCLSILAPHLTVRQIPDWDLRAALHQDPAGLATTLGEARFILCSSDFQAALSAEYGCTRDDVIPFPNIYFSGYHPDLVYVSNLAENRTSNQIRTPVGDYSSALVVYGYLSGRTIDETVRLFNMDTFERAGYLNVWEQDRKNLVAIGRHMSIDLDESIVDWARHGSFMWSFNHPKLIVTEEIAKLMLKRIDEKARDVRCSDFVPDWFINSQWPVYPEIGKHLMTQGAYVFKRAPHPDYDRFPDFMDLRQFVSLCFEEYALHEKEHFGCARVEAWLADPRGLLT